MSKALIHIVEDDPTLGSMLKKILAVNGYENVTVFSDGQECLNNLDVKPTLIILDFSLVTLNGLDVLKLIKERQPRTRVVIYSSLANDEELMQKCIKAGALSYFNKNEQGRKKLVDWINKKMKGGLLSFLK